MLNKSNPSRKRATGTEKSQDRPEHTALTLQTMDEQEQEVKQESSDTHNNNIDNATQQLANIDIIDNFDNIDRTELPVVHALTTPFPQGPIKVQAATLRKLKDQEQVIKQQQQQIKDLQFEITIQEGYNINLRRDASISREPSLPPPREPSLQDDIDVSLHLQAQELQQQEEYIHSLLDTLTARKQAQAERQQTLSSPSRLPTFTPGPHRLQPRAERPEDVTYRQQQQAQEQAEKASSPQEANSTQDEVLNVFKSLTKVLSDNNKQLHSSDVSEPQKFFGHDSHWEDWYLQWRTYLEAKGWLTTFEHPTGPGTVGFDNEINKKIYNKLLTLCQKGTASTYITKAANFNGWEAAKYLLERYEGFSKQRQQSLRKLIENIKHVHGTNISRHVDRFEKICGQMAHNNPTKPPTEENKIDWFLDSVTEKTYDSVHTTCTDKLLEGELTFAKMVKLYTHKCFQRYPHFQVEDIERDNKPMTNNSITVRRTKGTKGKGHLAHGRGRGTARPRDHSQPRHDPKGKGKGDRRPAKGKGKSKSTTRTPGKRQPKQEPCTYCGGDNHNARTCYKRIADETKTTVKTHKQANQNLLIDETAMEFSQSVLSVSFSDSPHSAEPHTVTWGENDTHETIDSDEDTRTTHNNTTDEETKPESQEENKEQDNKQEEDREYDTVLIDGVLYLAYRDDEGNETTVNSPKELSSHEDKVTTKEVYAEQTPTTSLPIVEPIPYSSGSELTGVPMTASMTPTEQQESSSVEPDWGRTRSKTLKELEDEWQIWEQTPTKGTQQDLEKEWEDWQEETSTTYHHSRCSLCYKPVTTKSLDPDRETLCQECEPNVIEEELNENTKGKQGNGRRDRDDEEEWGRIPIPQSDDSYSTEGWLSDESEQEEEEDLKKELSRQSDALAYLIGPRKDGRILTREGKIIDLQEDIQSSLIEQETSYDDLPNSGDPMVPPSWTRHLMSYQRYQLKKGYKGKQTQRKGNLMKQVRKTGQGSLKTSRQTTKTRAIELRSYSSLIQQFDTTAAFLNQPNDGSSTDASTRNQIPQAFKQCMNELQSPVRRKKHKQSPVKPSPQNGLSKRSRQTFSPITIPGTPEYTSHFAPSLASLDDAELPADGNEDHNTTTDDELEDIDLYYKVLSRYKPEPGESNAESASRHQSIDDEYQQLRREKRYQRSQQQATQKSHDLTPSTPRETSLQFRHDSFSSSSLRRTYDVSPIIEPAHPSPEPEHSNIITNNVQEVSIYTDYTLYTNPDKPITPQPIEVIYDTGAAITMLPEEYPYAWTNTRECLHILTGCFSGHTESNLKIGEFHGIITLDSGETRRVIIPESIQIPQGMSNTYLLADTAFLMAGHTYVSHLSQPKLKFNKGGTYTMSVTKGHKIIRILPTPANIETPHKTIYFHLDEPYDPPTFVNNVFYQCNNRPNAQTPSAFTWHLRFGCKCENVLKHTQNHVEGLQIRQGTLKDLSKLLPCSACLAGKMRKTNKQPHKNYTEINNLVTNAPLSWTPSTADKIVNPNLTVSLDWGIVNKKSKPGKMNVFALFLDVNTGLVFVHPAESRGQAGDALKKYIQRYGKPHTLIHDNAKEFVEGEFATLCEDQGIKQIRSPPYEPNKNPVEHYMDILSSSTRSMLFISGLDPDNFWHHALEHSVYLQIRQALPGRCTPYELTFGRTKCYKLEDFWE